MQPIVDLDTRVYFRTREISALTLRVLICFFLPQHYVPYVLTSLPCREVTAGLGKLGRELGWFLLCHCCQCWPSTSVTGQGPWPFPSIYLYACPCSLGSSVTSRIFPAASTFTTFFPYLSPIFSKTITSFHGSFFLAWNPKPLVFLIEIVYMQKHSTWSAL